MAFSSNKTKNRRRPFVLMQASSPADPIAEKVCTRHEAPPGIDYKENPTVFGKILRGKLPARTFAETDELLAFEDRAKRAPLHALVIPKRFIPTVNDLTPQDLPLLQAMRTMGLDLIRQYHPDAFASKDYILCFHVPPFNSVSHLHLHVLAPASTMKFRYRGPLGKYQVGTIWCASDEAVVKRLEQKGSRRKKPNVP